MKECIRCKDEYPATAEYFSIRKKNKDGLSGACRDCISMQQKEYAERNKEKIKQYHVDRVDKKREEQGLAPLLRKIAKEGYKICTACEKELLSTNEYFHNAKNSREGLFSKCKECRNKENREIAAIRREKERNFEIIETKYISKKDKMYFERKRAEKKKEKEEEMAYQRLINEPITEGLKLNDIKVEIGQNYIVGRMSGRKKNVKHFEGELIQETNRHITLRNKVGRCETFLKADLLLKVYEIKEAI